MKAVISNKYGSPDVLKYQEIPQPQIEDNQVLIKIYASSINPYDCKVRQGKYKFLTGNKFPMIFGLDVAGEIVEIGTKITKFKLGDQVYSFLPSPIGGAYAEYVAVTQEFITLKPHNLNYQEAATIPLAASTALQALRDQGKLKTGQKVLINGASGGVGTFAVQIAKALGAEVTGVCSSKNVELVQSLGADRVINYQQEDFTKEQIKYDIIFDVVCKSSFTQVQNILTSQGIYITLLPSLEIFIYSFLTSFLPGKKAIFYLAKSSANDLVYLKDLIEAGKVKPIIDRVYNLTEIVAAHQYSETGRAVGKIVIQIS